MNSSKLDHIISEIRDGLSELDRVVHEIHEEQNAIVNTIDHNPRFDFTADNNQEDSNE